MGFPSTVPQCSAGVCGTREVGTGGNRDRTRIIPEMSFTCSGTVTHWRAAGVFRTQGNALINSVLSTWRERSSEPGTYDRVGEIELGICGSQGVQAPLVMGTSNVYECTLLQSERVSVQPGDIVGIELHSANEAKFRLYFDNTNSGSANYVFDSHDSTFSLSLASSTVIPDQPQVSLTIEPVIATTIPILQTTLPPTMTETSSTTADLPTTLPPPTTEVPSMATTEPPTTTEALTTAAATEPPTTTPIAMEVTTTVNLAAGSTPEIPSSTGNTQTTQAPTTSMTNAPTMINAVTDPRPTTNSVSTSTSTDLSTATDATNTMSISTAMEDSITTSTITMAPPSMDEAVQPESDTNIGTITGAAVGGIIAVLLVLIIVLLLVLVLRRQNQNGQKFIPSNNATIVNPVYNGKPIVPNLEDIFHSFLLS